MSDFSIPIEINLGIFYACRKIGTNDYFLEREPGHRGGYTFMEPRPLSEGIIRLFKTEKAAKHAVIAWAKGRLVKVYKAGRDWNSFEGADDSDQYDYEPVSGRSREQIEIIQVELREYVR